MKAKTPTEVIRTEMCQTPIERLKAFPETGVVAMDKGLVVIGCLLRIEI